MNRDAVMLELRQNHAEYTEAFEKRLRHELSGDEYKKLERKLDAKGTKLREELGIGAKSYAGAYCRVCGGFFKTAASHREGFDSCSDHRYLQHCYAIKDVMRD